MGIYGILWFPLDINNLPCVLVGTSVIGLRFAHLLCGTKMLRGEALTKNPDLQYNDHSEARHRSP